LPTTNNKKLLQSEWIGRFSLSFIDVLVHVDDLLLFFPVVVVVVKVVEVVPDRGPLRTLLGLGFLLGFLLDSAQCYKTSCSVREATYM
jgi:hypothetical protein